MHMNAAVHKRLQTYVHRSLWVLQNCGGGGGSTISIQKTLFFHLNIKCKVNAYQCMRMPAYKICMQKHPCLYVYICAINS